MAGVSLRNRASLVHSKWDPEEYEWEPQALKVSKAKQKGQQQGSGPETTAVPGSGKVCQVEGCGCNLSSFKEYLQRYRICEYHQTLSCLVRDGVHQRFCQQCGKFQPLEEFDDDKRTCRRKLNRHNARRRKRRLKNSGGGGRGYGAADMDTSDDDEEEEQQQKVLVAAKENAEEGEQGRSSTSASTQAPRSPAISGGGSGRRAGRVPAPARTSSGVHKPRAAHSGGASGGAGQQPQSRAGRAGLRARSAGAGAKPPGGPLGEVLSQVVSGSAAAQASLAHLLDGPVSDADAELAVKSCFSMWAAGESEGVGAAALPGPLPDSRPASGMLAAPSLPTPEQLAAMASMDVDGLDFDSLQRLPSLLGAPSLGLTPPAAWAAVAQQQQQQQQVAAMAAVQPAAQPQAKPPMGPAGTEQTGHSSTSHLPVLRQVAAAQQAQQSSHQLFAKDLSTASSQLIPVPLPEGTVTDPCIAEADAFDALLDELFKEDEEMDNARGASTTSSAGASADFASYQLPPLQPAAPSAGLQPSWPPVAGSALAAPPLSPQLLGQVPTCFAPAAPTACYQPSSLASAMGMLGGCSAPQAAMQDRLVRMSLKMFNTMPDGLPCELLSEVMRLVSIPETVIEGFLRPGCVHLMLNALLDGDSLARLQGRGVRSVMEALLSEPSMEYMRERPMLVQLGDELAVVEGGRVLQVVSVPGSVGVAPAITHLEPLALGTPSMAQRSVVVRGRNLVGPHHRLLCRHQGQYPLVEIVGTSRAAAPHSRPAAGGTSDSALSSPRAAAATPAPSEDTSMSGGSALGDPAASAAGVAAAGSAGEDWVEFRLPTRPLGLVEVEVVRGAFLSGSRALLVLPCDQAAAELCQLQTNAAGVADPNGLLEGIGLVLRYLGGSEAQQGLTAADAVRLTSAARTAAVVAVFRGWPAVLRLMLPALGMDASLPDGGLSALDALCPPGQSLLHTAVASGSTELLQLLGEWGRQQSLQWAVATPGANGVTPLHLAALLRNASLLKSLFDLDPEGAKQAWATVCAADGGTPAQYAQLAKAAQLAVMPASQAQQARQAQLVQAVAGLSVSQRGGSPAPEADAAPPAAAPPAVATLRQRSSSLGTPSRAAAAAFAMVDRTGSGLLPAPTAPLAPASPGPAPVVTAERASSSRLDAAQLPPLAERASSSNSGLDLLLDAAMSKEDAAAAAAKLGPIQEGVQGTDEPPLKPHARRPGGDARGGSPPAWLTREWAPAPGADMDGVVAALRADLDEEARSQVEELLKQF